jgi:hypothetical protein
MKSEVQYWFLRFLRVCAATTVITVLIFMLSPDSLQAQFMVQPVSLAYLAQRADVIVQGQVREVLRESLPGYPNIPTTVVTLDVENMLRGKTGKTYTFREVYIGLHPQEGKQTYVAGQRLMLFLPSPSQYGLSSPVGIGQGRFHIGYNARGSAIVANERGNAELFKDVKQSATNAGMRLTPGQLRVASTERGPVALDEFVSLVRSLASLPRIQ